LGDLRGDLGGEPDTCARPFPLSFVLKGRLVLRPNVPVGVAFEVGFPVLLVLSVPNSDDFFTGSVLPNGKVEARMGFPAR
jgi:hypothetical protein